MRREAGECEAGLHWDVGEVHTVELSLVAGTYMLTV